MRLDPGTAAILALLAIAAAAVSAARLTYPPDPVEHGPKRCVVEPLHGGGLVKWCEPEARR